MINKYWIMNKRSQFEIANVSLVYYIILVVKYLFYIAPIVFIKVIAEESNPFQSIYLIIEVVMILLAVYVHILSIYSEMFKIYLYDFNYFHFKEKITQTDNIILMDIKNINEELYEDVPEPSKIKTGIYLYYSAIIITSLLSIYLIFIMADITIFIVISSILLFFYTKTMLKQFGYYKKYYSILLEDASDI